MTIFATAARLIRARSDLIGLAAVTGLSLASSAIGFIFQVVLAARFGAGVAIDTYLFSISAPTFLSALMSAALSYTLVPALVRLDHDPDERRATLRRLIRQSATIACAFALFGLPAAIVQPMVLPSGADVAAADVLPWMIALGWVVGGANLLAATFTIELNAARRPIVAAMLTLPTNLVAAIAVLFGPETILAVPVGVLTGSACAAAIGLLLVWPRLRGGADCDHRVPRQSVRAGGVGWTLLAMSCFSAYAIADAFWAPRSGIGVLATLGYAQRLLVGIGSLALAGPSAILVPKLSARLRDDGSAMFLRESARVAIAVGGIATVIAIALAVLSDPLVRLAFGRGQFGPDDAARVATVLRTMLPGFCAMMISVALTRAIYCLPGVERAMAAVGFGWSMTYFLLCGLGHHLAEVGFGISYSAAWIAYLLCTIVILRRFALTPVAVANHSGNVVKR